MVDDGTLGKIFSAASAAWTFVLMCAVALFKAWPNIMGRINERRRDDATEKGGDWDRRTAELERVHALLGNREKLLGDRDDENDTLRHENDALRQERSEWMGRAIKAEATLQGYGEARQLRAIDEATKRLPPPGGNGK